MLAGHITLGAKQSERYAQITISAESAATMPPPDSDFIREIVAAEGGSVEVHTSGNRVSFEFELPSADKITVLVVDDNTDLVHFYRRYTATTRYHIVNVSEGEKVFDAVANFAPNIIVLDVMLPDVDGWEMLTRLREHPDTRTIPVIVCTVTRGEELALALGAELYVPKPVGRLEFVQALEQISVGLQQERREFE
jgi:CheY-like chemotaxis protein